MSIGTLPRNAPLVIEGSYTLIEEFSPAGVSSVTFSNLGAYKDLKIVVTGRSTEAALGSIIAARFNGDTGNNYDRQVVVASNTTVSAGQGLAASSGIFGQMPGASATANFASITELIIGDYRGSTFFKQAYAPGSLQIGTASGDVQAGLTIIGWRNTAPITSITILLGGGNFAAGTKIALYGIGNAGQIQLNNTFQLIETKVPGVVSSVTFGDLGLFTHLQLLISGRTDRAGQTNEVIRIQFNGDTGNNYDRQVVAGIGGSALAGEAIASSSGIIGQLPAATAPANQGSIIAIVIPDYRGTTFLKQLIADFTLQVSNSSGGLLIASNQVGWRSNAAITSITILTENASNFVAGSKFSLYGIM